VKIVLFVFNGLSFLFVNDFNELAAGGRGELSGCIDWKKAELKSRYNPDCKVYNDKSNDYIHYDNSL